MITHPQRQGEQDVILLVDDNPTNLQVLYQTLQDMDCKLLIAKNGVDAIEVAEKASPALILLDIMMPDMNGYEVIEKLKANTHTKRSAVIFLSALGEAKHKVKGLQLGAVDYIEKPFQSTEVLARVNTHLKIYHLERSLEEKNQQLQADNTYILQAMGEGLIQLKENGEILYANPTATKISSWPLEKILGKDFHQLMQHSLINGERCSSSQSKIYQALEKGQSYSSDREVFWNQSGQYYAVEFSLTPLEENNPVAGAVLVFKDISIRKKNDEKLKQALKTVKKLTSRLEAENTYLQQELKSEQNTCGIVGENPLLKKVLAEVEQVAATDTTVLINGESGTGKEAIARAIHEYSLRKERPLIKVNCGAIAESLVESELFGHVKGAFTGAVGERAGHFELADGGTIFLDEVGELSMDMQVKLLRVLQEQEVQRVGSSKITKVDVRFIAATNRDLKQMVDNNEFRMDLYYRLNVFPLLIPPLRERKSDIPLLVSSFLNRLSKKLNKSLVSVSDESMDLLLDYDWPGNIRELQNVIERSAILATSAVIDVDDAIVPVNNSTSTSYLSTGVVHSDGKILTLAENERQHIINTLEQLDWVVGGKKGAAEMLGVPTSTLRSRMKKLGIKK